MKQFVDREAPRGQAFGVVAPEELFHPATHETYRL